MAFKFNQGEKALQKAFSLIDYRGAILAAAIFFILELTVVLFRYHTYYPSDTSYDQGIFNQVFWNGTYGRFFQSTLSSNLSVSTEIPEVTYHRLGQHFTPALLLWLPIYSLFPNATTLHIINVTLITAAGIVLYILARQRLETPIATLIAISYYCSGAVIGPTLGNFQDISQLPLFIFGLFLALEKRCWIGFTILAILILLVREDSGIVLFGIGTYLIFSRRYPWLGLTLCGVSFIYCLVVTSYIMPLFSHDIGHRFLVEEFGQYVDGHQTSSLSVLWGMLSNPFRLLIEFISPIPATLNYILGQFLPLAFVPAISGMSWLLIIFPLLALLLRQESWALSLNLRYALTLVPGLFYGTILWWSNHPWAIQSKRLKQFWRICMGLSVFLSLLGNPNSSLSFIIPDSIQPWIYLSPVRQIQHAQAINTLLPQIPANASVSSTNHIIPHISSRRELIRFPALELIDDAKAKVAVDYIMVDLWLMQQYQVAFKGDRIRLKERTREIERLLSENLYGLIGSQDGIVLLKRGVTSKPSALSNWKAYRQEIAPILRTPDET